jgi:hypothetical protein
MNKLQFVRENFSTQQACLEYLITSKWAQGYICRKCGHEKFMKGRTSYYRKCKSCNYDESDTSGTLFHKIKFSLVTAFEIIYWLTQSKKGMSTIELSVHFGISQQAAWKFKKKIQLAMNEKGSTQLNGLVEVDEFVVGGKEKKAQGRSLGKKNIGLLGIQTMVNSKGKKGIRSAFCTAINGYSSEDFKPFFDECIDDKAKIKTDKWSAYSPLKLEYRIRMVYSKTGKNFKELHYFIMNLKSWLKGIHHRVSGSHFQGYLDEFCFRFNRRYDRKPAWESLVDLMILHHPVTSKNLYKGK